MAKTYTAAGSAVAGDVYTAAAHNVIVTDINNTIVPPACVATAGAAQNIVNTTYTALTFSAEQFDTDAIHDTSTNTSRFTITTPGIYQMNAWVGVSGSSAGSIRVCAIRTNGTNYLWYALSTPILNSINVSGVYNLALNDYVEFIVYQDSGVTMTANADRIASIYFIGRTS